MQKNIGLSFSFGAAAGTGDQAIHFAQCLERLEEPLAEAAKWIKENAASGKPGFGWYNLPEENPADIVKAAEWLKSYDAIVHVGIGGSALGNLMLHQALLPMYHNDQAKEEKKPFFYLADNPDPVKTQAIWDCVKDLRVALIGVSKSGETAETMSQFLWFREQMRAKIGENADDNVLVITDPNRGVFRTFAKATGCRSLEIHPTVGGRFSVLSASGLVTLAALGGDVNALLSGALGMRAILDSNTTIRDNPARRLSAIHRFHERTGKSETVLMPYASKMEIFAEWFAQLWGESVGKDGMGATPVRALGAIDQHSQLQLYAEGPDNKLYTLVNVNDRETEIVLPQIKEPSLESLSYLASKGLGQMLSFEAQSTAAALIKAGRPLVWIEMEKIEERTLGALIFFYEYVTALTGYLMKINPFDQPGVEQGKRYTYGLMKREGFGEDADEAKRYFELARRDNVSI